MTSDDSTAAPPDEDELLVQIAAARVTAVGRCSCGWPTITMPTFGELCVRSARDVRRDAAGAIARPCTRRGFRDAGLPPDWLAALQADVGWVRKVYRTYIENSGK